MVSLAAAAAAAGFPAPEATQSSLVVNVTIKPSIVSWADIYTELKSIFEEIYGQEVLSGSAWDALLQLEAEHIYNIQSLSLYSDVSFNPATEKLHELLGDPPPFKPIKRLANCA